MSPSGAEIIKQIKERIHEVDPAEVREGLGNGVVLVDVREGEEFERERIPGAVHVPRGYLESRIEGAVVRPRRPRRPLLRLGPALGARRRHAAGLLGYTNVDSMTGGITLWKDRGYDTEVPKTLTKEQRDRYSRHLLLPEVGVEGQQKLLDAKVLLLGAGGLGSPAALYLAAAGVGTLGIVDDDTVDLSNLQRQVIHTTDRVGEPKVDSAAETDRARSTPTSRWSSTRCAWTARTSSSSSSPTTSWSTASTTSPPATCSTTRRCGCASRSCRRRSSASTGSSRCSSPTRARATAACTRCRRRPSSRPRAAPTA